MCLEVFSQARRSNGILVRFTKFSPAAKLFVFKNYIVIKFQMACKSNIIHKVIFLKMASVMLVTSRCWRLLVGNSFRMLVTKMVKTLINIKNLSATNLVSNVRHHYRCSHEGVHLNIIFNNTFVQCIRLVHLYSACF